MITDQCSSNPQPVTTTTVKSCDNSKMHLAIVNECEIVKRFQYGNFICSSNGIVRHVGKKDSCLRKNEAKLLEFDILVWIRLVLYGSI